jgi:hypothetical protein
LKSKEATESSKPQNLTPENLKTFNTTKTSQRILEHHHAIMLLTFCEALKRKHKRTLGNLGSKSKEATGSTKPKKLKSFNTTKPQQEYWNIVMKPNC